MPPPIASWAHCPPSREGRQGWSGPSLPTLPGVVAWRAGPYVRVMDDSEPNDLQDSTPGSSGRHRAGGEMGVSSERPGPTGPGQHTTDGVRDTSTPDEDVPRDDLPP